MESVPLPPGLYLVATPIGNLRDMTLRALDVLAGVDVVLCEDTRVTAKLLHAHGLRVPRLEVYSDHSADRMRPKVLKELSAGARIALVSDAGMPLISDPGYKLVRDAQDLGLPVTSLPGANAVLTAVQLSGLPSDKFCFLGFLPPKSAARQAVLREWAHVPGTLVVYETGPRLIDSLGDMLAVLGPRDCAVARELTKMFEEVRRDSLPNLISAYQVDGAPKGEIVIVIAPPQSVEWSAADIDAALRKAMENMSLKDAAAYVAEQSGVAKKKIYDRALDLKE